MLTMNYVFYLFRAEGVPTMQAKVGSTGYLDQTRPGDMPGKIALGTDRFGRPFISLLADDGVLTAFQRRTDDENLWVFGMANCKTKGNYKLARELGVDGRSDAPDPHKVAAFMWQKIEEGNMPCGYCDSKRGVDSDGRCLSCQSL